MPTREKAYGEAGPLTIIDRLGVWLSHHQVGRWVPSMDGKVLGDFGCGYHATQSAGFLKRVERAFLLDVAVDPSLRAHPKVTAFEGLVPATLARIHDSTLDVVLCLSVIEHLDAPQQMLNEIYRVLASGGRALVNVPSWRGKRFLEFSAFQLGLSPALEMDDHRTYYDVRDLWPLLVRAGFRPSSIRCWPHKLGLNTFAVCDKK